MLADHWARGDFRLDNIKEKLSRNGQKGKDLRAMIITI